MEQGRHQLAKQPLKAPTLLQAMGRLMIAAKEANIDVVVLSDRLRCNYGLKGSMENTDGVCHSFSLSCRPPTLRRYQKIQRCQLHVPLSTLIALLNTNVAESSSLQVCHNAEPPLAAYMSLNHFTNSFVPQFSYPCHPASPSEYGVYGTAPNSPTPAGPRQHEYYSVEVHTLYAPNAVAVHSDEIPAPTTDRRIAPETLPCSTTNSNEYRLPHSPILPMHDAQPSLPKYDYGYFHILAEVNHSIGYDATEVLLHDHPYQSRVLEDLPVPQSSPHDTAGVETVTLSKEIEENFLSPAAQARTAILWEDVCDWLIIAMPKVDWKEATMRRALMNTAAAVTAEILMQLTQRRESLQWKALKHVAMQSLHTIHEIFGEPARRKCIVADSHKEHRKPMGPATPMSFRNRRLAWLVKQTA